MYSDEPKYYDKKQVKQMLLTYLKKEKKRPHIKPGTHKANIKELVATKNDCVVAFCQLCLIPSVPKSCT